MSPVGRPEVRDLPDPEPDRASALAKLFESHNRRLISFLANRLASGIEPA